ncbi:hypothetical protein [[Actinomadura] parvosata]|uniref:hypothetical protein n=1 Tax=[Actinomadura] parvosata TaxID=1955412 RepID=UPI0016491509
MREQGLTWLSLPAPVAAGTRPPHTGRYGIMDAGDATRYGYRLPLPTPAQARRDAVWASGEKLPPKEKLALDGAQGHDGGCRGRARAQVTGAAPRTGWSRSTGTPRRRSRRPSAKPRLSP